MTPYADTDENISERRHDPLCIYRDDEWLDARDCGECNIIFRVRVDEREKPINAIPRAICNSESFMWLMAGSNHSEMQLNALRPVWAEYCNVGGGWGRKVIPLDVRPAVYDVIEKSDKPRWRRWLLDG